MGVGQRAGIQPAQSVDLFSGQGRVDWVSHGSWSSHGGAKARFGGLPGLK